MYSVVNRVAHYELGFAEVDRLAVLWSTDTQRGIREQPPTWEIVQAHPRARSVVRVVRLLPGQRRAGHAVDDHRERRRVAQMPVDVNALSVVGVKPLLGRTYRLEDFNDVVKQKEARAIVISYDTWQRRLGGSPDVIGTTIHVDGEPRTVIGVMPEGFALVPWEDNDRVLGRQRSAAGSLRRAG